MSRPYISSPLPCVANLRTRSLFVLKPQQRREPRQGTSLPQEFVLKDVGGGGMLAIRSKREDPSLNDNNPYLQQLLRRRPTSHIHTQTNRQESLQLPTQRLRFLQRRSPVRRDQVQRL